MKKDRKDFFGERLNRICIKKKLWLLQIICVLFPLLIIDSVIIMLLINADRQARQQEMDNIAESVRYTVTTSIEASGVLLNKVYTNENINEFIQKEFSSSLEYYDYYVELVEDTIHTMNMGSRYLYIYADNPGIVNGGYCRRLEKAEDNPYYNTIMNEKSELMIFWDTAEDQIYTKRTITLLRRMDYLTGGGTKAILRLDLDYSQLLRSIINAKYSNIVYVCVGDHILFSNEGRGGLYAPFEEVSEHIINENGIHKTMKIYGEEWKIYVMPGRNTVRDTIRENIPLVIALVLGSIILPFVWMNLTNRSFTQRIMTLYEALEAALENKEDDEIEVLAEVSGTDEISMLMESYNHMADRMNDLIQNEYKNRLRRQETNIAKQKAELLALHSQVNPHFLFNALESIRMHSVLKQEYETADMVEKLALMQRQNVEWGRDLVPLKEELKFIEAYLELQKYRFGDRLKYELEVPEMFWKQRVPRLTLVTFVENACVHGMESKSTTVWIFVRVYERGDEVIFEVEDTGNGMDESMCEYLTKSMQESSIEMLHREKHVGMLNAALRLKMYTGEKVRFEVESEYSAGTLITVAVPKGVLTMGRTQKESENGEGEDDARGYVESINGG